MSNTTLERNELDPNILTKVKNISTKLKKGNIDLRDWKIINELLTSYISFKKYSGVKLTIPARSRVTIPIETYCLNLDKAIPQKKEVYFWNKKDPSISFYSQLLELRRDGNIEYDKLQSLLWNLENKTVWEDYPKKQQATLLKIDSRASFKLPSRAKSNAKEIIKDYFFMTPKLDKLTKDYKLIRGKYYSSQEIISSMQELASQYILEEHDELVKVEGTEIYVQSESNGYTKQNVTFFNQTQADLQIDLREYYLSPIRKDVQRIGINRTRTPAHLLSAINLLDKLFPLIREAAEIIGVTTVTAIVLDKLNEIFNKINIKELKKNDNSSEKISKVKNKAIEKLKQRKKEHIDKLKEYKKNPQKFDNKGHLKNSPDRQKVINGRVKHLENEVKNFDKQIKDLSGQ